VYEGLVYVRNLVGYSTSGITINSADGTLAGSFNSDYSSAFWDNTAIYTQAEMLTAVDISTETTAWTAPAPAGENYSCAPIIVNGVAYVGTTAGNVLAYATGGGENVFSIALGQAISSYEYFSVPVAGMTAGNGLLVVPAGNQVVALQYNV